MSEGTALPLDATLAATNKDTPHQTSASLIKSTNVNTNETAARPRPETSLREVCADINGRVERFLSASPLNEVTRTAQEQTRIAQSVILQALRDYDFDSLSLSYNGGKDCLVLLILYLSVLHTYFTQPSGRRKPQENNTNSNNSENLSSTSNTTINPSDYFPTSIPSIYAKPPDPFDSVTKFVDESTRDYHLDLVHISTNPSSKPNAKSHSSPPPTTGHHTPTIAATTAAAASSAANSLHSTINGIISKSAPSTNDPNNNNMISSNEPTTTTTATSTANKPIISFRDAFALYLHNHPQIRAIFVGTRRTDPHGTTLEHFQMTDGNWPRFMRIHPVIDWRLSEIWCFLRSEHLADPRTGKRLDYCGMYDAGYTSLGGVGDTLRNPKLRYIDQDGQERYRPAHEMTDDEEERAGRE